ncbi:hypothetical protein [Hymenobacter cellulosivorans]|uniref:Lipoprotein n=1 Tax=Hymenobacter cellulosivorans TaxID=2932249 RepID=A0ABY4F8N5_9BACT|nr:hypothetical protein [Hymenobacter cellulosivorans]UOQ53033.1 hypothetical protein MUN80_25265 [Hymenobacter cellulosivorans]
MKYTCYRLFAAVMASAVVAGCETPELAPPPVLKAQSSSDLTFISFPVPEPLVEVTSVEYYNGAVRKKWEKPEALGASQVPGGHPIYVFQPRGTPGDANTVGTWTRISGPNGGGAVKIAAGYEYNGTVGFRYVVTDQNELWVSSGNSPGWRKINHPAVDVAVAYGNTASVYVYFLGAATVNGGHPIYRYRWDTGQAVEVVPGAAGIELAVDRDGRPWVTTSNQQVWVGPAPGSSGGFVPVEASAGDIACTVDDVAVLGTGSAPLPGGYEVYKRPYSSPLESYTWTWEGGQATRIGSSFNGKFFLIDSFGQLHMAQ